MTEEFADWAVRALSALAHESRLQVHRLLVQAGEDGLSAGAIAERLGMPASSLSFHLSHMQAADMVNQRREGRSLNSTTAPQLGSTHHWYAASMGSRPSVRPTQVSLLSGGCTGAS